MSYSPGTGVRGPPASIDDSGGEPVSDATQPPEPTRRVRRGPMRLLHLMVLVAAVALTLVIAPGLMHVIRQLLSGWGRSEQLAYKTDLALLIWTPVLTLIVVIANRRRIRRVCRSYGTASVIAAA